MKWGLVAGCAALFVCTIVHLFVPSYSWGWVCGCAIGTAIGNWFAVTLVRVFARPRNRRRLLPGAGHRGDMAPKEKHNEL